MQAFKNKRVLIFGLGLNQGGVGSARFFASRGAQVKVTDLKDAQSLKPSLNQLKDFPEITYTLGEHKYEDTNWADLIIKNPAVKPGNPYLDYAQKSGKRVEQDMGIFLDYVKPSQIIGITGTKGKSTTASLIYEVLKAEGPERSRRVILAGNIGKSVLDTVPIITPDTLVILEISSFQLEPFATHKISPHSAVITNIFPDHLNYYKSMEDYMLAKKIIGLYQKSKDFVFLNKDDTTLSSPNFINGFAGKIIFFSSSDLPKGFDPSLEGVHNKSNMAAALAVAKTFAVKKNQALKIMADFKSIPFRMELIKDWRGFKIYNDTTATNPTATIEALKTLGPKNEKEELNIILICGGMDKGMDYEPLKESIGNSVKALYFLEGDVVDKIICDLPDGSIIEGRFDNLGSLLSKLKRDIKERSFFFKKSDIILFSPAATSFNLFQNEFDRGRKFNEAVEKIFK